VRQCPHGLSEQSNAQKPAERLSMSGHQAAVQRHRAHAFVTRENRDHNDQIPAHRAEEREDPIGAQSNEEDRQQRQPTKRGNPL
jgi:hypothetical protein